MFKTGFADFQQSPLLFVSNGTEQKISYFMYFLVTWTLMTPHTWPGVCSLGRHGGDAARMYPLRPCFGVSSWRMEWMASVHYGVRERIRVGYQGLRAAAMVVGVGARG
jgi:hypothetical protein